MTDFARRRTMMVDTQVRPSDVTKFPIIDAMLAVPKETFVPREKRDMAYIGENIELAPGRVVLEPRTLGKMLDAVDPANSDLALVVGAGLGYTAAVLARIAEAVVAVEDDETRASETQTNLSDTDVDNVILHTGPLADGAAEHGPYDLILVEGGVVEVPDALLDQLKEGGRIACIFMDGALGAVQLGVKANGRVNWRFAFNAGAPVLTGFERMSSFAL